MMRIMCGRGGKDMCRGMKQSLWLTVIIGGICLVLFSGGSPAMALDDGSNKDIHIQVLLGATEFSDLTFDQQGVTDPTLTAENEIGAMPEFGICVAMPLNRAPVDLGLEGGVLFGWRSDSVTAYGTSGTIRLHLDNDLYLFDLFIGPYAATRIGKHMRIYAGTGPLLMYGQYKVESDEQENAVQTARDTDTSSTFGGGFYARTGIEYIFNDGSMIGFCVRGFNSRLNFSDVSGDTDIKGVQFLLTFSASPDLYK